MKKSDILSTALATAITLSMVGGRRDRAQRLSWEPRPLLPRRQGPSKKRRVRVNNLPLFYMIRRSRKINRRNKSASKPKVAR